MPLLIHSFVSQSQISQELHNHQYYLISINESIFSIKSTNYIKKDQTIKIEKRKKYSLSENILP